MPQGNKGHPPGKEWKGAKITGAWRTEKVGREGVRMGYWALCIEDIPCGSQPSI